MGKRNRRRKRERARAVKTAPPKSVTLAFPEDEPRVLVVIEPGTDPQIQALCAAYWEVRGDGTWARTVASITTTTGATDVAALVSGASHGLLLKSLCTHCDEPVEVTNRSWAAKVAGRNLDRENNRYLCQSCGAVQRKAAEEEREQKAAAARAEQQRKKDEEAKNAEIITACLQREGKIAEGPLSPLSPIELSSAAVATYLGLQRIAESTPKSSMSGRGVLWNDDKDTEYTALAELYRTQRIALHDKTPHTAFVIGEDGQAPFLPLQAQWQLVGDLEQTRHFLQRVCRALLLAPGEPAAVLRAEFLKLARTMESMHIAEYLDGLLTRTYDYPVVPENRRPELMETISKGLDQGYTSGQMICFAWRAADTAASWKERHAKAGPPEAASASVTILARKMEEAAERRQPVPEYTAPAWLGQPPALTPATELAAEIRRVRNPDVIRLCEACDNNGLVSDEDKGTVSRCLHQAKIPRQVHDDHESDSESTPLP